MKRDLLVELGVEELPSSFLREGLRSMREAAEQLLREARLAYHAIETLGTPRRMAMIIRGLADRQPDREERVMGPAAKIAFTPEGELTRAALGFIQKNKRAPEDVIRVETEKGEYIALDIHEPGKTAEELLPRILEETCKRIHFAKSMRWGDNPVAFGRPLHHLVALLGDTLIPFEFAGLKAQRTTFGHRFLAPERFELRGADAYRDQLRERHVIVDTEERRERMKRGLDRVAKEIGGEWIVDDFLIEECLSLVEYPFVIPGSFDPKYLELPSEVVISVMRDHQRYFAMRDPDGNLLPAYLNVVGTANEPALIQKGNDRVLRARLEDARFFVEEDRAIPLADRVPRLDAIVFQNKLGSVGDKVRRIDALAQWLAPDGLDKARVSLAATLAKADLETLIVGEFPELEGAMGRYYALSEGIDPEVADTILDHYHPRGAHDSLPATELASAVALADRLDTLVGCFGIGLMPTGSADPFALRRAALGVIRIALEGQLDVDLRAALDQAYALYGDKLELSVEETRAKLLDFFIGRLRVFLRERAPSEIVEACIGAWEKNSLRDLLARVEALLAFRETPAFEALAVAFKRANNIVKDAPEGAHDARLFQEPAERALREAFLGIEEELKERVEARDYSAALQLLGDELRGPIDAFFNDVFVMVDDEQVRSNRLRLLREIADAVNRIAHLHLL
ncbi:MAG: glycine--tRNA ligase subunit beta [Sandaracinaceae bacterium]|nr:glycine--tRNA ligase subunit beta [Sandaracinaceae bacterium]